MQICKRYQPPLCRKRAEVKRRAYYRRSPSPPSTVHNKQLFSTNLMTLHGNIVVEIWLRSLAMLIEFEKAYSDLVDTWSGHLAKQHREYLALSSSILPYWKEAALPLRL